jgi:hypothetical protein
MPKNPCLSCGACCAFFRASFYWGEADDVALDGVPVEMTQELTSFYRVMKGTNCASPRCMALNGEIGVDAQCSIYARRSSACRNFEPSWEHGAPNERCDQARAAYGLPPLTPESWKDDQPEPQDPDFPHTTLRPAA